MRTAAALALTIVAAGPAQACPEAEPSEDRHVAQSRQRAEIRCLERALAAREAWEAVARNEGRAIERHQAARERLGKWRVRIAQEIGLRAAKRWTAAIERADVGWREIPEGDDVEPPEVPTEELARAGYDAVARIESAPGQCLVNGGFFKPYPHEPGRGACRDRGAHRLYWATEYAKARRAERRVACDTERWSPRQPRWTWPRCDAPQMRSRARTGGAALAGRRELEKLRRYEQRLGALNEWP